MNSDLSLTQPYKNFQKENEDDFEIDVAVICRSKILKLFLIKNNKLYLRSFCLLKIIFIPFFIYNCTFSLLTLDMKYLQVSCHNLL